MSVEKLRKCGGKQWSSSTFFLHAKYQIGNKIMIQKYQKRKIFENDLKKIQTWRWRLRKFPSHHSQELPNCFNPRESLKRWASMASLRLSFWLPSTSIFLKAFWKRTTLVDPCRRVAPWSDIDKGCHSFFGGLFVAFLTSFYSCRQ